MDTTEEFAIVRSFIVKDKRERFLSFLSNPKRRGEITRRLADGREIDSRCHVKIAADQQDPASIAKLLKARGAGADCYVLSENKTLDGKRMLLLEALAQTVGYGMGTIISCVPGALAYFEGEGQSHRVILTSPVSGR